MENNKLFTVLVIYFDGNTDGKIIESYQNYISDSYYFYEVKRNAMCRFDHMTFHDCKVATYEFETPKEGFWEIAKYLKSKKDILGFHYTIEDEDRKPIVEVTCLSH